MKTWLYLIFDQNDFVAARKNNPNLSSGQIAVRVSVEIPGKWFNRSTPQVSLVLPDPPNAEATIVMDPKFVEPKAEED